MGNIPFSGIRKIYQAAVGLETQGHEIIHLEIGRPDFDTPEHIKQAARQALDQGFVHYTSNYGIPELRTAIADKLARENGIHVNPENEIIVTVGANEAVLLVCLSFLDVGDEVLIPDPAWAHYYHCVELAGAVAVHVPCSDQHDFRVSPNDLDRALSPRTKMILLTTPHNPTGAMLDETTLRSIAHMAQQHDLLVVSDEIYEKITYDGIGHYSIAALSGMDDRTITLNGFSKAYSMTGWRLGYVAARKPFVDAMIRVHQYSTTCANSFAQMGAVAAIQGSQACVEQMVTEFRRRRDVLWQALQSMPGISCVRPAGAFYVFPCIRDFGVSSEALALHLLHEAGVAVVPGSVFGHFGEGYLRIAYANSYENILKAVDRIDSALRRLSSRQIHT
jgi:aspartate/methionine/tyrosine aminotransferase